MYRREDRGVDSIRVYVKALARILMWHEAAIGCWYRNELARLNLVQTSPSE